MDGLDYLNQSSSCCSLLSTHTNYRYRCEVIMNKAKYTQTTSRECADCVWNWVNCVLYNITKQTHIQRRAHTYTCWTQLRMMHRTGKMKTWDIPYLTWLCLCRKIFHLCEFGDGKTIHKIYLLCFISSQEILRPNIISKMALFGVLLSSTTTTQKFQFPSFPFKTLT